MATRTWAPPGPYDLGRTLGVLGRGPGDPAYRQDPDGSVWRASRTPAGPGTLHLVPRDGGVRAEAWGPGADWLLETLPTLLGATDDPEAFVPRHRLLHEAHRRNPGLRLARTGLVMESLIPAVLEQKVTSDEAYRAWRLLLQRHGEPAPGPAPRMRVMPEPRAWALIPSWEWHRAGVDGKRSAAIVRAARSAARLEEAAEMDGPAAAARLQAIPGIGPWTAAETIQRSNGAPDAVTVGDLHLPRTVGYALTGARGTDDAGMLDLLAPYEGQRHRACRLILLMTRAQPRRAPRLSVNDIRGL
ncbi:DNA-3-methyladenine glycosylase family protein [Streptomyces albireticuli]|uniref:3-methyladenine DNA glycosylase n=1 Tax=Streptomyces albireticuli TaxID=1940 RepID=A0A2A2D522_9ACTN|nr:DNA-3-methyladenine glycosylase [Streptomyces albireticuli]MCD9144605.1 DNA-3-methyladenine glycosylase [Streptomyces albireticuli]MCD9163332.1 DNA-3-methyladenine glycosylase [Streptomyces albireticuli]MCD9193283.1 DNA-3-methyladenine glycosylase [Streptomyces albireticuli]PAU46410.1 3-methyladenine DNA glycosylase [Streptomyces albireticuli]